MGHAIAARFEGLAAIVDDEVTAWMAWRCAQTARLIAMLAGGRVLVFPTTPCPALPTTAGEAERGRFYATALAVNALAGLAGLPQLSLPIATTADGLPLGLSVVGAPGTDMTLLSLATTLASRGDLALLNP
jgi:amidase